MTTRKRTLAFALGGGACGALQAGANEQELLETAFTIIPVAGMPSFAVFLEAWRQAQPAEA